MKIISCDCLQRHCDSINLVVPQANLTPKVERYLNRYNKYVYNIILVDKKGTKREREELIQIGARYCQDCGKLIEVENE